MDQVLLDIGQRLRALRRTQKLSLLEAASRAGITKGMLSKVETGRTIPSLPVLLRLIKGMECEADEFFQGIQFTPKPLYIHRRACDAQPLEREIAALGFNYTQLLEGSGDDFVIRSVILRIEPGSRREKVTTDAFEYKYVLEGVLEYEIGDETILLRKGDSLFYDGRIPHVPRNRTQKTARMLVVYIHDHLLPIPTP